MDEFLIELQAKLNEAKSKGNINDDIKRIQSQVNKLKMQVEIDPKAISDLSKQLESLINQKITLSNIGVDRSELARTGQQIEQVISNSAEKAIANVGSKNIGKYFKVSSSDSHQFQAEMEKLVIGWTNGRGKVTDINIQTRTSYDKDAEETVERLHQATVTYENGLDEVIKKTIAWRQIGTAINGKGEEVAIRGFVEVAGQYSKSIDMASAKTDNFAKKKKESILNFQNTINQITSRAFDPNSSKPITSDASLEKLNTQIAYTENAMHDLHNATSSTFNDAKLKVQEEISALKILENELRNADNVSIKMKGTDIASGLAIAKNDLEKFKSDAKDFPQITKTIQELDVAIANVGDASSLNSFNDQLRVARSELAKVKSETSTANRNEKVGINVSGLQSRIAALQRISPEIDKFKAEINGAEVTIQNLLSELAKVNTQSDFSVVSSKFKSFTTAAKSAGIATSEFGSIIKTQFKQARDAILQTLSIGSVVSLAISKTKESISELKELNSILTEIGKTSNLTEKQLKDLGSSAFDAASKYGKTATDYLTGVQEMYRAGFANAEKMAELSILAQAAGDMDATSANDYLIASNAAYNLKGNIEELNRVLDGQNFITNNAAVSMIDMAQATSEAASIASQYGIEIDELSSLIAVATSKTRESGSETGTALKALFVNLQDTTSKPIKEAFEAVNISMTEMADGSERLKTPIALLKELSDTFVSLDEGDVKRANILNDIGGKQHANTLSAILSDWSSYEEMLSLYSRGMGSAAEEAEKSTNNWEGSLNRLSNTWTDTVGNIANSDSIIAGINSLNNLLSIINNITDKLGSLGTIGLGAGLFAGVKNLG